MRNDNLGDRMKTYENVTRTHLVRRMPVIIRIDGKAFHTFTKGFGKPFDEVMVKSMQDTMKYLCENVEGCVLGYTQSDEITLVLCDYKKLTSQAWFDNNIQKMCSVSASMATMAFNRFFFEEIKKFGEEHKLSCMAIFNNPKNEITKLHDAYWKAYHKGAMFDSRVFNIPKEEVNNCLLWRQLDATRNSIQAVAQVNFSPKQLHGKNCNELQEMLFQEKSINWSDYETHLKRGSCCIKTTRQIVAPNGETVMRSQWIVDKEIPIFSQDATYVNDRIVFD